MGGKNDGGGTSTTTPMVPPWLEAILKPLLGGSASKLQTLQNQGYDVLQGNTPQTGVSLEELGGGGAGTTPGSAGHGGPMPDIPLGP